MIRRTPAVVRAVETAERRIAWALLEDGSPLVATESALYAGGERLAWTDVARASWDKPVLTVVEVADVDGTGLVHRWTVAEDSGLAVRLRAAVTGSIAWSDVRMLPSGRTVRLVGRRSGGEDLLTWQVVWSSTADADDPLLREQVDAWVVELRRTIG